MSLLEVTIHKLILLEFFVALGIYIRIYEKKFHYIEIYTLINYVYGKIAISRVEIKPNISIKIRRRGRLEWNVSKGMFLVHKLTKIICVKCNAGI